MSEFGKQGCVWGEKSQVSHDSHREVKTGCAKKMIYVKSASWGVWDKQTEGTSYTQRTCLPQLAHRVGERSKTGDDLNVESRRNGFPRLVASQDGSRSSICYGRRMTFLSGSDAGGS